MTNKPKFSFEIGWYKRLLGYYLYFWDEENRLKYITNFSRTISSEIINDYQKEIGRLGRERKKQCSITMKSESSRLDASLSNIVTAGVAFIAIIFSLVIVVFQSLFQELQKFTLPLPWILNVFMIIAFVALIFVLQDIRINARKCAHLAIILSILEEKDNQITCSESSRDIWMEISHIGHLHDKGYVTEDEFVTIKAELLSRL